ncbi:phage recombination protein Bet [Clostridium cellulovorans]|jgi:phage recombination protein Bet|uniref:Phage recombination protein Bet n=1 Tax=Clostridium cellulovorans (strain ATCC 35296 / DSM 3052 / OCM 3 / 743B) TaxID=573061 RepID=D9SWG0_CLOC7|nr:phage recombination protein Bet [Clostridium cellulovorans]ADL53242.1 phage recombination protein Bet [Clostridium cellulovorans 743B]
MENQTGLINIAEYEVAGEKIKLSSAVVKKYLVSGQANKVSDQEVGMFLKLCQGQKLNPFLREAYLVKYGDQAAQMIVGKDAFTKRAETNENYKGSKSGIIIINLKGELEEREGTFYLSKHKEKKEELVGGWAKVFFKNDKEEVYHTVSFDEYNTGKSLWGSKPATMIRKVALVQALREAFPNSLSQLYTAEEVGVDEDLPTDPVNVEDRMREENKVEEPPKMATTKEKKLLMDIARAKGLVDGSDISKLEGFAIECKFNLRNLSSWDCSELIKLVKLYEEPTEEERNIQDVVFEPVEGVSSEEPPTKEESPQDGEETEEDPF